MAKPLTSQLGSSHVPILPQEVPVAVANDEGGPFTNASPIVETKVQRSA